MSPGLAMFVLAVMAFVAAAVTFAIVEYLAANSDPAKCAPDCPACAEPSGPRIKFWDSDGNFVREGVPSDVQLRFDSRELGDDGMWHDVTEDNPALYPDEYARVVNGRIVPAEPAHRDVAFSLNIPELDNIPQK